MKNTINLFILLSLIFSISCKAQQNPDFKEELDINIQTKKTDYIGKNINHLLSNISYPVKSYIGSSYSDKTNHITVYFISINEVRNRKKIPIAITIYFTEEKMMSTIDEMLRRNKLLWTNEEIAFFGNLIVEDVYVGGYP